LTGAPPQEPPTDQAAAQASAAGQAEPEQSADETAAQSSSAGQTQSELPADQTAVLASAAGQIQIVKEIQALNDLLPDHLITKSDETTSHYISQEYIIRLRHASQTGGFGANIQLWLGGTFGAIAGGTLGLVQFFRDPTKFDASHLINILVLFAFAAGTLALFRRKTGDIETVPGICDEIEKRKKSKANNNSV
jgi:hypothetical protein